MGSIRKKLAYLVLLAVLPALAILLYSGIEQRQRSIDNAKRDVSVLVHAMAESQSDITLVTRQMLSTLALLPQIQALDAEASSQIFKALVDKNPGHYNFSLIDLNGNVIASNRPFSPIYLGDRKHFIEALERKDIAAGEFILTRLGPAIPAFPFAYPVMDEKGNALAVLATVIDLSYLADYYEPTLNTERAFLAATDHKGLRLLYSPYKDSTNPLGQPINPSSWAMASQAQGPGIFAGHGSDGVSRIFAFEPVRLDSDSAPYLYVWAGIPESYILEPANTTLIRNLLLMLLAAAASLVLSWTIGRNAFVTPINNLMEITKKFSEGNLDARSELPTKRNEFWVLTNAFNDMAGNLQLSQSALAASEKQTRLILNSATEAIYGVDRSGRCTFCNQSFLDMLGYQSEQDLLGRNMHELIHHSTIDGTPNPVENCQIYEAFKTGEHIRNDSEVLWKADGTCFPIEYCSNFLQENGEVTGAVVSFLDITERKRAQIERENLIAQLQDKSAEQERFVYTVSHDLKSPLVTISGFLGLVKQDFATGDKAGFKANIAVIANAAQHMSQLLDELLELSRVGNKTKEHELVNLGHLINKAIESLSGQIRDAGATLEVESDLPDILVDPQRFLQVIENLIGNAVKFSGSAEGGTVISIGVRRGNGESIFYVKDNGVGIDSRHLDKVFELFEMLDPQTGGTGIGLAIVKRIVEVHGGRVWAESEGLGHGSTFCLTLPEVKN